MFHFLAELFYGYSDFFYQNNNLLMRVRFLKSKNYNTVVEKTHQTFIDEGWDFISQKDFYDMKTKSHKVIKVRIS